MKIEFVKGTQYYTVKGKEILNMEPYFDFVNKTYTQSEIVNRVKSYVGRATQVNELLAQGDTSEAVKFAKPIKTDLKLEYKVYTRVKDRKSIQMDKEASTYLSWISDVALKTSGNITSKNVDSFTYDIKDYASFYYRGFF